MRGKIDRLSRARGEDWGIGLFIQDGAYTTLAAAVTILVTLTLLFSAATATWTLSRAGDVQLAADATALAGSNAVASYYALATAVDASVLSLGLAGFAMCGAGMAGLLVPGANAKAAELIDAGVRALETRNGFCESASKGLGALEKSLPYLVAARGTAACGAQRAGVLVYTGTALAVPRESDSVFPALEGGSISTEGLESAAGSLQEAATELQAARERSAKAKEKAWLVDCGRPGKNMQERAAGLTGLSAGENPDYESSISWNPRIALERTMSYYRWRRDNNGPESGGLEAKVDEAARSAFYAYACGEFEHASYWERDGRVVIDIPRLPVNTQEARLTPLCTEAIWPVTREMGGLTLHYGPECPGARGALAGTASLLDVDEGAVERCEACKMTCTTIGKVPAPTSVIESGYEYHLREFTDALHEYAAARNAQADIEEAARGEAGEAKGAFEKALDSLACERPRIAPPGNAGCVALVASDRFESPDGLKSSFAPSVSMDARGAIAGAALARDPAARGEDVLAGFFEGVGEKGGLGDALGGVMRLWGRLLGAYGELGQDLDRLMGELLGGLEGAGAGPVAEWLGRSVGEAMKGLGLEPVDLALRKPVLVDSARILQVSDYGGVAELQERLRSIEAGTTDPEAVLSAMGYEIGEHIASMEWTVAEIPLPGGKTIPLTIRLRDMLGAWGG